MLILSKGHISKICSRHAVKSSQKSTRMTEPNVSRVRSQFAAEVDEAFNSRSSWSTHTRPLSYLTAQNRVEDDEEMGTDVSTSSFLSSQYGQEIVSGVNHQEQQPIIHCHAWSEEETARPITFAAQELSVDRRPSESESQLPILDSHSVASKNPSSSAEKSMHIMSLSPCTWLSLTLRWPFMMALFIFTLALGFLAIFFQLILTRITVYVITVIPRCFTLPGDFFRL